MMLTESAITLDFPDNNFFRLCDCKGYKDLQNNFAEMDVCWFDKDKDVLYIIELKNWNNNQLSEENDPNFPKEKIEAMKQGISDYRIRNLLKKSIDTTCMFMSILLNKPYGNNIQQCSPFRITKKTKIILLSIINWTEPDNNYISIINTDYKSKFNSYAKLFDIKTFVVLTKEKAKQMFTWVN